MNYIWSMLSIIHIIYLSSPGKQNNCQHVEVPKLIYASPLDQPRICHQLGSTFISRTYYRNTGALKITPELFVALCKLGRCRQFCPCFACVPPRASVSLVKNIQKRLHRRSLICKRLLFFKHHPQCFDVASIIDIACTQL